MANPQEQPYTEMVKQAQDALLALLDTRFSRRCRPLRQ
jgi:hypothetical protein